MRYESYMYLFPPRAEEALDKPQLKLFERRGYVAQVKKNGTSNVIFVSPERVVTAMNRHEEAHKLWAPTEASSAIFKTLPGTGWFVFCAELLHSKVKGGPRDTNYIHDILVADGEYLVGTTQAERQRILHTLFLTGREPETYSHWVLNPNTWLVREHTRDFPSLFEWIERRAIREDEGLVLKNPRAKLAMCSRPNANSIWQVKLRLETKNYRN